MVVHTGGCHCGRVRFEVTAPANIEVSDCNCSICSKGGYLHLVVPADRFKLLSGADALTTYRFNTGTAKHRHREAPVLFGLRRQILLRASLAPRRLQCQCAVS